MPTAGRQMPTDVQGLPKYGPTSKDGRTIFTPMPRGVALESALRQLRQSDDGGASQISPQMLASAGADPAGDG
eukprot:300847-Alexandrium_andersonii.AAC.1